MKHLFTLAAALENLFNEKKWKYCFIGGIALQRWGQPRMTVDIDITLLTGIGGEERFIEELLRHFPGRIKNPKEFALAYRVLLLESSDRIGIDIALAGFPFEEQVVARATPYEFLPGLSLRTCSAEDLIVLKSFADRMQDWVDVEGILIRQKGRLDWPYIQNQLGPLCQLKEAPDIFDRLQELFQKVMEQPE